MELRRAATIAGLGLALEACGVSAGGLDPNDIEPLPPDASDSTSGPALDAATTSNAQTAQDASQSDGRGEAAVDPCPLSGTFALTLEADVRWEGTRLFGIVPIILPGQGKVVVKTLIDIGEAPEHPVSVRACGAQVPDFGSSIGEVYSAVFPDEVWDRLALRWNTRAQFSCANPGCDFGAEPVVAQLGIDIPPSSGWPTPRDPIAPDVQRDDDRDGLPGVRVRMRGPAEGMYAHPPTSFLLVSRVSEIQLAIRLAATLNGTLTSCDERSGLTTAMTLDIRALACRLDDGSPCDEFELGFVDDNLPVWSVQGASFRAVRVPRFAGCADARQH